MVVAIVVQDALKAGISNCKPSKGATPSTLKHAGGTGAKRGGVAWWRVDLGNCK